MTHKSRTEAIQRAEREITSAYGFAFDIALQAAAEKAARTMAETEAQSLIDEALAIRAGKS
jgi:hypothetical protein